MLRNFCLLLLITSIYHSSGQVISINCYIQNPRILPDTTDLIQNGSFENSNCNVGIDIICPNSGGYSCDIDNWVCTGGGYNTYARTVDSTFSFFPDNSRAVYFGNYYCEVCNPPLTLCPIDSECIVLNVYPSHNTYSGYGDSVGVRLEQEIDSLIIGHIYLLEFWAGGEMFTSPPTIYPPGIFAVEIDDERFYLRCVQTEPVSGIGKRYVIEFIATSTNETIRFINWGHINSGGATELVLDDVRLIDSNLLNEIITVDNDRIILFPNPFTGKVTIKSDYEIRKFDVINCIGKVVYSSTPFNNVIDFYRGDLGPGVYICRIVLDNNKVTTYRLLIY